jgi:hypothetical protein
VFEKLCCYEMAMFAIPETASSRLEVALVIVLYEIVFPACSDTDVSRPLMSRLTTFRQFQIMSNDFR